MAPLRARNVRYILNCTPQKKDGGVSSLAAIQRCFQSRDSAGEEQKRWCSDRCLEVPNFHEKEKIEYCRLVMQVFCWVQSKRRPGHS